MRTERRSLNGEVTFVAVDLAAAEFEATRALGWRELEGGAGCTFPRHTRYLGRAYENFSTHTSTMIRQMIDPQMLPWETTLARVLDILEPLGIPWYLPGSAAMAVRGIPVVPGDIDLATDLSGASALEEALHESLVQPLVSTPGWVAESFTRAFMGMRVEWIGGVRADVDGGEPTDFGPKAASRLDRVPWKGHIVPVPPLDLQLAVTKRRGREERARRIEEWLEAAADRADK